MRGSIFSDVAGDITIIVDGESFLLHKVITINNTYLSVSWTSLTCIDFISSEL